jgi:serine/threonine protein kinase
VSGLRPFAQLLESFVSDEQLHLVMPFYIVGNLQDQMKGQVSLHETLKIIAQIATAIEFLHKVSTTVFDGGKSSYSLHIF